MNELNKSVNDRRVQLVWIGLQRTGRDEWQWCSGEPALYLNWELGQPQGRDYCGMMLRFKVQGSCLFVTYTIIQGIISSEMEVRTGPLNGQCKKIKIKDDT